MLFAVDIGNTQTVIGVYDKNADKRLCASWRIATNKDFAKDDIKSKLLPLFSESAIEADDIGNAVMASVVPSLTKAWQSAINEMFDVEALVCTAELGQKSGLFDADYPNPSEIGSDRVADAIAIKALFGCPAIIVDFGTATNMEVIDAAGKFVGGVIAPGLQTSASALFEHASGLATMEMSVPDSVIGKSTKEALRSGIILGEAARVDGLIDKMLEDPNICPEGSTCAVVATGGLAECVASCSRHISTVEPNLTLHGLFLLAKSLDRMV